jgi:uncharacterized protein with GYD domain
MAQFMLQVAYTSQAWASLVKRPQDRAAAIRPVIEKLGGKLVSAWLSFGDYDSIVVCDMPDNVSAAAFSIAVSAGGAIKAAKTTPLMTLEEGVQAMKKAQGLGYKTP